MWTGYKTFIKGWFTLYDLYDTILLCYCTELKLSNISRISGFERSCVQLIALCERAIRLSLKAGSHFTICMIRFFCAIILSSK